MLVQVGDVGGLAALEQHLIECRGHHDANIQMARTLGHSYSKYGFRLKAAAFEIGQAKEIARHVCNALWLAERGRVELVTYAVFDADAKWIQTDYEAPMFADSRHNPLISGEHLASFVESAFPIFANQKILTDTELFTALDHFVTTRAVGTIWPSAVGCFTAIETLKSAWKAQRISKDPSVDLYVAESEYKPPRNLFKQILSINHQVGSRRILNRCSDLWMFHMNQLK